LEGIPYSTEYYGAHTWFLRLFLKFFSHFFQWSIPGQVIYAFKNDSNSNASSSSSIAQTQFDQIMGSTVEAAKNAREAVNAINDTQQLMVKSFILPLKKMHYPIINRPVNYYYYYYYYFLID